MANVQSPAAGKAKPVATPRKRATKAEKALLSPSADATAQTLKMEAAPEHTITEEQRQADKQADAPVKVDASSNFVSDATAEPASNNAAFAAELEALKAKFNVNAEVVVKAPKATKVMQNGVTRPAEGTQCGKIWALADEISRIQHTVAAVASVREHSSMKEVNDHTIKTQYAKWRKFHGISGRLPTIHAVHQEPPAGYDDLAHNIVKPLAVPAEPKKE